MPGPYFTVLTNITYPFFSPCFNWRATRPSIRCPNPGFFAELVGLISNGLKLKSRFISMDDYLRQMPNKNPSASEDNIIAEELRYGRFDMIANVYDKHFDLFGEGFEVSAPLFFTESRYVAAAVSSNLSGIFAFFAIYDLPIWLSLFGTIVAFILAGCFIYWLSPSYKIQERRSFGKIIWHFIRLELMQHDNPREKIFSLNALFFIFALLNCGIFIQMYNSLIASQTVRKFSNMPFKTNEVLKVLKERKYSLLFRKRTDVYYLDIKWSDDLEFFEIRDILERYNNPAIFSEDFSGEYANIDPNKMLSNGRYITISNVESILISRRYGMCNNYYYETGFPEKSLHLLFRKNHPLLSKINKIIVKEAVNIRRLYERYFNLEDRSACKKRSTGPKALTIVPYCGILIVFGGGIILAFSAFLCELCAKRNKLFF